MNKKFAIFDMDGTLVDSMVYWKALAGEYLKSKGVEKMPEYVEERIKAMTMTESAALFIGEFHLAGTPEMVAAEMNDMLDNHYRCDIPLKPGVINYLQHLQKMGCRMCVASATAEHLMAACLGRLGILDCFEFLLSCESVGAGKDRPDIYFTVAQKLGAEPGDIGVFEDALYAVETAKKAGFYVVGIYDESGSENWKKIEELADETIRSW